MKNLQLFNNYGQLFYYTISGNATEEKEFTHTRHKQ